MNRYLFQQELTRLLHRSPARLTLLAIYFVVALWSGLDGVQWKSSTLDAQRERPAGLRHERESWTQELKDVESGKEDSPYKARPMNLTLLASLPPGPLAELAHRRESIHPHTALISGWKNDSSLFRRYEIEGPSALVLNVVDLSYIAVVLLPLVLLLSTFDALSSERQSGRLRLLIVHGLAPQTLLGVRIATVAVPLWLGTLLIAIAVSWGAGSALTSAPFALWCAALTVYVLFWSSIAAWIASRFARNTDTALAAMATWVTLVLLVPSFVQFAAEWVYPTPSRVVYLTQARAAEAEARRELERRAEVYMAEHDIEEGESAKKVPKYYQAAFLANANINAKTAPLVRSLQEGRQAQVDLLSRIELVAPPMLASRVLQDAAGVGSERAAKYREQVRTHLKRLHDLVGPATVAKRRINLEQAQAIPDFRFEPSPITSRSWLALVWLAVLAAGIGAWALRQARGLTVVK